MLASLSAFELAEWMAYASVEPFGGLRDDFRAGMVCATVANYAGQRRLDELPQSQPADYFSTLPAAKLPGARLESDDGILLADPVEHAALIRRAIFKKED